MLVSHFKVKQKFSHKSPGQTVPHCPLARIEPHPIHSFPSKGNTATIAATGQTLSPEGEQTPGTNPGSVDAEGRVV